MVILALRAFSRLATIVGNTVFRALAFISLNTVGSSHALLFRVLFSFSTRVLFINSSSSPNPNVESTLNKISSIVASGVAALCFSVSSSILGMYEFGSESPSTSSGFVGGLYGAATRRISDLCGSIID